MGLVALHGGNCGPEGPSGPSRSRSFRVVDILSRRSSWGTGNWATLLVLNAQGEEVRDGLTRAEVSIMCPEVVGNRTGYQACEHLESRIWYLDGEI